MCYNAAQTARKLYKEAKRIGVSDEELARLKAEVDKHDRIVDYYQVSSINNERLLVGGLTSEWTNITTGEQMKTLTIVTTKGNELMSEIHNNPKLAEPRMPLIFKEEDTNQWLEGNSDDAKELIKPYDGDDIKAVAVNKILGKASLGNVEDAQKEFFYQELNTLF